MEHSFAYSPHTFQAPETFNIRNSPRFTHYPHALFNQPSDDDILEMVIKKINEKFENRTLSQSTDNDAVKVEGRGRQPSAEEDIPEDVPERAEDVPERVDSPVVPCTSSTVDGGRGHDEGGSKEDGENAPLFRNTDHHTNSRPDTHSSEMGKEGTSSINPVSEEMEEDDDLYCMTEFDVPYNASQRGKPSPDNLSPVEMIVLPDEVALKMYERYEDVTDDERPQMDVKPPKRAESLLEPSCKCMDILVETDDGFVTQPCPACVRRQELQKIEREWNGIDEMQEDEQGELIVDESPSVSGAHADGDASTVNYQSENETEDEEEDDDDWIVIGPFAVKSLQYIPPEVASKSAPASSSRLEVFDNMECFKEAKAKQLGIDPDHIHDVESNAGTAAPIVAPARSRLPFRAAPPQRSPQHSAETSPFLMPLSPLTVLEHSSDSSSDDSDLLGRNDRRKVKRRKLHSKSKSVASDHSKSKAESDNKPADCQKRGLISPEMERGPCTPQSNNSSETENSSDCSMSPPQRNRLTFPSHERSNSPLISQYKRSISTSESGACDDNGDAASSPLVRRSVSHEPERPKIKTSILKTLLATSLNDTEKKQGKNRDDRESGSGGGCSPESASAPRLDRSREALSLSRQRSPESTVNPVRAKEKPSYSRQSSAPVTKANVFKLGEGLPPLASKEGPSTSAFSLPGPSSGIREKLKNQVYRLYQPGQSSGGKLTSVEMDEEKSMPGPPANSQEPAPGKRRSSHVLPEHRPVPMRQRHKSNENPPLLKKNQNPLWKKTIAEARGETKRKATRVAQDEPSGSRDGSRGFRNYKWNEKNPRAASPVELDWANRV